MDVQDVLTWARSVSWVHYLTYFLACNVLTFLAFRSDKQRAINGQRRWPESDLLLLMLAGGTPSAFAAQQMFRHKTRKQPFVTYMIVIAAAQFGLVMAMLLPAG
jgi:uncharacterized membrane protein YsdA (DUF1294 family)